MSKSLLLKILLATILLVAGAVLTFAQNVAPAQSAQPRQGAYILGYEDDILVNVLNHPELSGDFLVANDGTVELPGVGTIKAAGLTLSQVAEEYRTRLKADMAVGLLKPVVTVSLKTPRTNRIYVLGQVKATGVYDFKPGWRISEALAAAGGLEYGGGVGANNGAGMVGTETQLADYNVTVQHVGGSNAQTVSLADAANNVPGKNLPLQPGDTISFLRIPLLTVYVSGNVARPGIYQIRSDQNTLLNAVAVAGGVTPLGSLRNVSVLSTSGQARTVDVAPRRGSAASHTDEKVQSGDLITVLDVQRIAVLGLVKSPGVYPMSEAKEFRLSDALGTAGGFDRRARLSRIAIFHSEHGVPSRKIYDFIAYLDKAKAEMNPVLNDGDIVFVPETNAPDIASLQAIAGFLLSAAYLGIAYK